MKKGLLLTVGVLVGVGLGISGLVYANGTQQNSPLQASESKVQTMIDKAEEIGGQKLKEALKKVGFNSMSEMHNLMSSKEGFKKMQEFMDEYGQENMQEMHNAMTSDPELQGTGCH